MGSQDTKLADAIVCVANEAFQFNTAIFEELDIVAGLRTAGEIKATKGKAQAEANQAQVRSYHALGNRLSATFLCSVFRSMSPGG